MLIYTQGEIEELAGLVLTERLSDVDEQFFGKCGAIRKPLVLAYTLS